MADPIAIIIWHNIREGENSSMFCDFLFWASPTENLPSHFLVKPRNLLTEKRTIFLDNLIFIFAFKKPKYCKSIKYNCIAHIPQSFIYYALRRGPIEVCVAITRTISQRYVLQRTLASATRRKIFIKRFFCQWFSDTNQFKIPCCIINNTLCWKNFVRFFHDNLVALTEIVYQKIRDKFNKLCIQNCESLIKFWECNEI